MLSLGNIVHIHDAPPGNIDRVPHRKSTTLRAATRRMGAIGADLADIDGKLIGMGVAPSLHHAGAMAERMRPDRNGG